MVTSHHTPNYPPMHAEPEEPARAYLTSTPAATISNNHPTWTASSAVKATSAVEDSDRWSLPLDAVKGTCCSWQVEATKGDYGRQEESEHDGTRGNIKRGQLVVGYQQQGMARIGSEKRAPPESKKAAAPESIHQENGRHVKGNGGQQVEASLKNCLTDFRKEHLESSSLSKAGGS